MTEEISIIGAGIGGLTAALALKQKGYRATVYESAAEIRPVGAGIVLASNAMQLYKRLGMEASIANAGNKISTMTITDEKLKPISTLELSEFEKRYGVFNVAIHRGALQKILADEVGREHIKLSKRLVKIEQQETINLFFGDDSKATSKRVIAADGIRSATREQLFGTGEIRDAKQACWRGTADISLPEKYTHQAIESWGKGKRFGFVKIGPDSVYWFAVINAALAKHSDTSFKHLFNEFHPDIRRILSETPDENIIFGKLTDLKPISNWHQKNVCLIGDAAHATTPNLGQGACQAIEDAYTLGQLYTPDKPFEMICEEYERLRMQKAHYIVNTSRTLGKIAQLENSMGIWLRNTMLRSLPSRANSRQLADLFDVDYI